MKTFKMRTRLLGGQRPIDITVQAMPLSDEGDKAEVILTLGGAVESQQAVIGMRPGEAMRLSRLLNEAWQRL